MFLLFLSFVVWFSAQPTVCERELCVFAFQTLGVMNEAADEIATGAQVQHHCKYFPLTLSFPGQKTAVWALSARGPPRDLFLVLTHSLWSARYIFTDHVNMNGCHLNQMWDCFNSIGGGSVSVHVSLSARVPQERRYFRAISVCRGPQWSSDPRLQSKGKGAECYWSSSHLSRVIHLAAITSQSSCISLCKCIPFSRKGVDVVVVFCRRRIMSGWCEPLTALHPSERWPRYLHISSLLPYLYPGEDLLILLCRKLTLFFWVFLQTCTYYHLGSNK